MLSSNKIPFSLLITVFYIYYFRYKSNFSLEVGIQWNNIAFASKAASESGPNSRDHCALLMDEMIITNGIVYSVSQQKVYGLAELACHGIQNQIYQDFYKCTGTDNLGGPSLRFGI